MISIKKIRQTLYRTILFGGICGFEIAAGLTSLVDTLSTPVSIAVRLFVATCALITVMLDFPKAFSSSRRLILGYCFFWYLYLIRVTYSTMFSNENLIHDAPVYYLWSIGACALPMLGVSLWSPKFQDAESNFKGLFALLVIGGLLASFGASSLEINQSNQLIETGRLQLVSLNPILLGQLGTTLVVLAVWVLVNQFKSYRLGMKLTFSIAGLIGAGLLIGSNSRGPLVSAVICLLFMCLVSRKRGRLYAMAVLAVAMISFVPVTQYFEAEFGISTYSRLFDQSQLAEENTLHRLSRYDGAVDAFLENPLLGSSLEEPKHGGYPHNIFIEALMATGIFGFLLLFALISATLLCAIKIYVSVPTYGWASVLFVQYLVAAQFSGSIYTVNYLWITSGLVIAIFASLMPRKRYRNALFSHQQTSTSKFSRI